MNEASTEELEAALKKRKAAEAKKLAEEKEKYENERDEAVQKMISNAAIINNHLIKFKNELHKLFNDYEKKLQEYGKMNKQSKGGFSLISADGQMKATRIRSTEPHWDERSTKAVQLIKEFLGDTVKKRDKKLFEILLSFIEKNKNGDLEYNKVMSLIQHEDKYNDERWKEGLRLIKESYNIHMRGYGYEFFMKTSEGKWHKIELSFPRI